MSAKRAISTSNVHTAKFTTLPFEGQFFAAVGSPERTGTHIILGPSKNGKTTFAMMYAKYLCQFERVAYDSIEEGLSLTIQMAMDRVNMWEVGSKLILYDKTEIDDLVEILDKHKSPNIVFIDSIQFADMTFKQYKMLKRRYPNKLFVYISHMEGTSAQGKCAQRIYKDAGVIWHVEGFRALPTPRYSADGVTGEAIDIWAEGANKYWGLQNQLNK